MIIWLLRQLSILIISLMIFISAIVLLPRTATCQCLIYLAYVEGSHSWHEVVLYDVPTGLRYPLISYANLRDLTVSPDGERLYFVQNRPNRLLYFDIYTGKIGTILNGFVEYPILSRDGRMLAYVLDMNFGADITTYAGIQLMQTDNRLYEHISNLRNVPIAWQPDNQDLTMSLWNDELSQSEIWSIDIDSNEQTLVLTHNTPIAWHEWHPSENLLAYASNDWVYIHNLDTGERIPLTINSRRPVWSYDGKLLAYIEQQDPLGNATINLATSDGVIIRRIPYAGNGFITRANWWQAR